MLSLKSLTYAQGVFPLYSNLSFDVESGASLQLLGENGVGKSTLLRILAGLIPPPQNTIFWNDEDILKNITAYHKQLLFVGHKNGVVQEWTVGENMQSWQRFYTVCDAQGYHALTQLGIENLYDRPAFSLSEGEQRRLALSRLMLVERPLWLLDEPTTGLDEHGQHLLDVLVTQHCEGGGCVIAATHRPFAWPDSTPLTLTRPVHKEAA